MTPQTPAIGTGPSAAYDAVIIGAGLVGAALTLRLLQLGLRVALVDPSPALNAAAVKQVQAEAPSGDIATYDVRVSALSPASRRLLEDIEVWSSIQDAAQPYTSMRIWDARNGGRIGFDAMDVQQPDLGCIVENRIVLAALYQRLAAAAAEPKAQLRLVRGKLRGILPAQDDSRLLTIDTIAADGEPPAKALTLSSRLIVGADGPGSQTRRLLDIPTREWDYGQQAIVATVAFDESHDSVAWQHFTPSGPLALLPLRAHLGQQGSPGGHEGRLISIVWSQDHDEARALMAADDETFLQHLNAASEGCIGTAIAAGKRVSVPLRQCHARRYHMDAAVLIGDAAHVIHPLAGRGVNLGLKDVTALAASIERGLGRGLLPGHIETLRRYELQRRPDNLAVMAMMEGFHRGFTSRSALLNNLLNRGMSAVHALHPLKRKIISLAMN
ncbi:FAD-dependent monooxygenase [Allohahella marinimesophila]|uniref:2-octaprenyl-3-methyl-6-methoxy-1,4-benzoquinol hydroxylase n=1 Tax=Allohahella marinimesophila TaxID=1054972 RepID=A0ABP7PKD6_9GAMM